jgi:hypothetical protein
MYQPIETTIILFGGSLASGASSTVNIAGSYSDPYPYQSNQRRMAVTPITDTHISGGPSHRMLKNAHYPHSQLPPQTQPKKRKHRFTKRQKELIASSQNWQCNICHNRLHDVEYIDIDHIRPYSIDPSRLDWPNISNLKALHKLCHQYKTRIENSKNSHKAYQELEHPTSFMWLHFVDRVFINGLFDEHDAYY